MTTTATENTPDRTSSARASRSRNRSADHAEDRAVLHFTGAAEATESAVTELVRGAVTTAVSLVPAVLVRPTATVDAVFAIVEQVVTAARSVSYEVASLVEAGVDAAQAQAA